MLSSVQAPDSPEPLDSGRSCPPLASRRHWQCTNVQVFIYGV